MEKSELHDQIDAYLDGTMSDAARADMEHQLKSDADLRAQVQLQKELKAAYQNPARLRLRSVMADIMEEDLADHANTSKEKGDWSKWIGLIVVILVLFTIAIWWIVNPGPAEQEINSTPVADKAPISTPSLGKDSLPPVIMEDIPDAAEDNKLQVSPDETPPAANSKTDPVEKNIPIAAIDPAVFELNDSRETMLAGIYTRSTEAIKIVLQLPARDTTFASQPGNRIAINFSGTITSTNGSELPALTLFVYDNKQRRPIADFEIPLVAGVVNKTGQFQQILALNLAPGLYYFFLESEEGDLLNGGKFFIR
ncbi:MAG: hypothetical protein R2828_29665 [Saprospiraceae bacterium]